MHIGSRWIVSWAWLASGLVSLAQAQDGSVTFSRGGQPREVQVAVKNGDNACGMQVQFSDGRAERKRVEPGETWTISHTTPGDGNFQIAVEGVTVPRGLRTVGPCRFNGGAVFAVAGGQSTLQVVAGAEGAPARPAAAAAGGQPAAASAGAAAPAAPQAARGPQQDVLVLLRKESREVRLVSTLEGSRRISNVDDVVRRGLSVCLLKYPDAYPGLSNDAVNAAYLSELGRHLAQMTGGRAVPTRAENCIADEGGPNARFESRTEVLLVQRSAYPILANSSPAFAQGYEALHEIGQAAVFAAADREREAAARRQQLVAERAADLERLAQANARDKVGSITLGAPPSGDKIPFCTLPYEGELGAAILGYGYRGLETQSAGFRSQAERARATVDTSRTFAKVYANLEALYEATQTRGAECVIYVDYPANLKRIMDALQRDRKTVVLNELIAVADLRDGWAKRAGYSDYAQYQTAQEMKVNAQQLKSLADYQIRDRAGLEAVVREMQASRYSAGDAVADVLSYLKDKAEAATRPGATALTVKTARDRAAQEAAEARAAAEQRRRQEYAREYPYIAVLTCGMGDHINILACFSGGSRGVDTELRLTNGSEVNLYKVYNLRQAGQERRDGFYIDLRNNFNIRAQNADGTLVLGLKIIDRATNRVLLEDKAARFGVVAARN